MSGGGSSNASVEYPAYMQSTHNDWLQGATTIDPENTQYMGVDLCVVALMKVAMSGVSPYSGHSPVAVDTVFMGIQELTDFISPYARLNTFGGIDPDTYFDRYLREDTAEVNAVLAADSAFLDDEIATRIIPKLHAGMADINAVQSSSFVLGEAVILGDKLKTISKSSADMRYKRLTDGSDLALRRFITTHDFHKSLATIAIELARIYAQTRHDLDGLEYELKAKDRLFDLSVYQYGVNVMASISGAASVTNVGGSGKTTGGAISAVATGAAMGAMTGTGPVGIGIGAAVGLGAYYLS